MIIQDDKIAAHEARLNVLDEYVSSLHTKIDQMLDYQRRQQGFIAGIVFTVGAFASGIAWFFNDVFHLK